MGSIVALPVTQRPPGVITPLLGGLKLVSTCWWFCQPQWGNGEVWTVNVIEVSNHTCWPSMVWAVNMIEKEKCLLTWLLIVLNVLTVLTTNK